MPTSKRRLNAIDQKKREGGHPLRTGNLPFHRNLFSILIALLLLAMTLAVFWQVRNHDFINFDDDEYVTDNPHVKNGLTLKGVIWAFTATHAGNWHPLTWLSHMLDCELYGLKPGGHHLSNLLFHIANTLVMFLVLKQMTGTVWDSGFVAALFALHPLHVESVAWVAERKDVLSAFFWMLTMWSYVRYAKGPRLDRYLVVLLSFALGLLSKPMVVTLPFVLLLLDYWPLGRLRSWKPDIGSDSEIAISTGKAITEKIPFFILSGLSSIVTFFVQQQEGAVGSIEFYPLGARAANALVSYVVYIKKMLWPDALGIFYPLQYPLPAWEAPVAGLLLIGVTFLVLRSRSRYPYLAIGWLWYLGTLVPVIGLVQVGAQALADRYTYIPLIGLFMMIAWGAPDLLARSHHRRAVLALSAGTVVLLLAIVTRLQIVRWENSVSLFQYTLSIAKSPIIHNNLGFTLVRQGNEREGMVHFVEALRLNPDYVEAHKNLGKSLAQQGKIEEASAHYEKVLRMKPEDAEAHYRIGFLLSRLGKSEEAIFHYREAFRIEPSHRNAHNNLGVLFARQGRTQEAIEQFSEVLKIAPGNAEAHSNLANCLLAQGKIEEAVTHYTEALRIQPGQALARYGLANTLVRQGKMEEAIIQYKESLRLKPDFAEAHLALGLAYITIGDRESAMKQYRLLGEINPALADPLAHKLVK